MGKSGGGSRRPSSSVAERKATPTLSKNGKRVGRPPKETLHERSERSQREGHLRPELPPAAKGDHLFEMPPVADRVYAESHPREIDPSQPIDAQRQARIYGEHAVARILNAFSTHKLQEEAQLLGITGGRSKAETLSKIVSHVTQGRYSANFPREATITRASSTSRPSRSAKNRGRTIRDPFATQLTPIRVIEGHIIDPARPVDPYFLRAVYGTQQLTRALSLYGMSKLRETAQSIGVKSGKAKDTAIRNIADAVNKVPTENILRHYRDHVTANTPYWVTHPTS